MKFTDLIVEYPNVLPDELCEEIIARFETDENVKDGVTGGGYKPDTKQSRDLLLSRYSSWVDIDKKLFNLFTPYVDQYTTILNKKLKRKFTDITDSGYQIQKTVPGGFYSWHDDHMFKTRGKLETVDGVVPTLERFATYIFYLNDVPEESAGATKFFFDKEYSYRPEKGKLLLFPSTKLYTHCGDILSSGVKYIITGWLYDEDVLYDVVE